MATDDVTTQAIDDTLECSRICEETLPYCLQQGGRHVEPEHIKLLMDCADICRTAAAFMQRVSRYHTEVCRLCAMICQACADDCAQFSGDEQMMRCSEACRQCAASCGQMAGAAA
ncbi:four-helix bundle copper-binding protein [Rhizomonospora bruguierae]|uniref:four-helix bundle copper-binding protein n=1 Tax=Rhizomonospora bruguierae TaxID=1581705 RepID=UPI001BCAFFAF|nr:four-helix bundle copper-binding protein [Micromonospora sp. NBRC 107566]